MENKDEIIALILIELRKAQVEPWQPPSYRKDRELRLPPSLPLSNGRQLSVTIALIEAVSDYSKVTLADDPKLKFLFKHTELRNIVQRVFGEVLELLDLEKSDTELGGPVRAEVDAKLQETIERHRQSIQLTLGCHLFDGDAAYPIIIGPVVFETREQWRLRAICESKLTKVTARRLKAAWEGQKLRKRKASHDSIREQVLLDTIGASSVVCTVSTDGLSSDMIKEKGLLAARLAMTAISLIWTKPSQSLAWMNLRYDGQTFDRHYVLFRKDGYAGSSSGISQMPSGRWIDDELISYLETYQRLFDQVGEALNNYVQPTMTAIRPLTMNALFLSLWWFYEACREPSDQMAATQFAASMDALSGGRKAKGITNLIEARLGVGPNNSIMKDGRTVKKVMSEIYDAGRSRMIHGSSDRFAHDWSDIRSAAEAIGRHCLTAAILWLADNPKSDDIRALSKK